MPYFPQIVAVPILLSKFLPIFLTSWLCPNNYVQSMDTFTICVDVLIFVSKPHIFLISLWALCGCPKICVGYHGNQWICRPLRCISASCLLRLFLSMWKVAESWGRPQVLPPLHTHTRLLLLPPHPPPTSHHIFSPTHSFLELYINVTCCCFLSERRPRGGNYLWISGAKRAPHARHMNSLTW